VLGMLVDCGREASGCFELRETPLSDADAFVMLVSGWVLAMGCAKGDPWLLVCRRERCALEMLRTVA